MKETVAAIHMGRVVNTLGFFYRNNNNNACDKKLKRAIKAHMFLFAAW